VDYLFELADLELSTRVTNEGYIARTLSPTIGSYALRKLQDRVDIFDRLYGHLRSCSKLCDGKPGLMDHRTNKPHECQPLGKPKAKPRACGIVLWLAATTGARRAELVALRWRDIDFRLGLLLLDENYVVRNGQRTIKGTSRAERLQTMPSWSFEMTQDAGFREGLVRYEAWLRSVILLRVPESWRNITRNDAMGEYPAAGVRRPRGALHHPLMPAEHVLRGTRGHVPDPPGAVPRGGSDPARIGGPGSAAHCGGMPDQRLFDVALGERRHQCPARENGRRALSEGRHRQQDRGSRAASGSKAIGCRSGWFIRRLAGGAGPAERAVHLGIAGRHAGTRQVRAA
jgi:hypothetical protein